MTVHHSIGWIIEPTDATIIRCIFLELNQSQRVSGIIMPIIRRTRKRLVKTALQSNNSFQKVHTTYTTAPHNHSQHNQASSHEVLASLVLVLLMMGIMMPETCWDWYNSGNIHLIIVASVGSIIHMVIFLNFKAVCYCSLLPYISECNAFFARVNVLHRTGVLLI
jgi:hypothetical protein